MEGRVNPNSVQNVASIPTTLCKSVILEQKPIGQIYQNNDENVLLMSPTVSVFPTSQTVQTALEFTWSHINTKGTWIRQFEERNYKIVIISI